MRYIGIDTGKDGGIAVLDQQGQILTARRMPKSDGKADYDRLQTMLYRQCGADDLVAIESVHSFSKRQKVQPVGKGGQVGPETTMTVAPVHTMQATLINYGRYLRTLEALGLNYIQVHPSSWPASFRTKQLGAISGTGKDATKKRKARNLLTVRALWPGAERTLGKDLNEGTVDAILIAEHVRRQRVRQQKGTA